MRPTPTEELLHKRQCLLEPSPAYQMVLATADHPVHVQALRSVYEYHTLQWLQIHNRKGIPVRTGNLQSFYLAQWGGGPHPENTTSHLEQLLYPDSLKTWAFRLRKKWGMKWMIEGPGSHWRRSHKGEGGTYTKMRTQSASLCTFECQHMTTSGFKLSLASGQYFGLSLVPKWYHFWNPKWSPLLVWSCLVSFGFCC